MNPFTEYLPHFKMCRIPYGTKAPLDDGWSKQPVDGLEEGYQYGILHQFSGTCAIDIDELQRAKDLFSSRGLDLESFLNSGLQITSGRTDHAKLIYRVPFVLPSKKYTYKGDSGTNDYLNFRCFGMQDCLPPSIHPDTQKPYEWIGDWKSIPQIPQEILTWWLEELKAPVKQADPIELPSDEKTAHLLKHCDYNADRQTWINVGMALHAISEDYFPMWDHWSSLSQTKYSGTAHNEVQWRSFKERPDGITPRSLEYYARQGGWKPDLEAALKLFKEVPVEDGVVLEIDGTPMPELPLEVLPEALRVYAEEVAESVGANPIVPVAAGLAALATAADSRSRLKIQEDFEVPPIIWVMTVGSPSAKKSPASIPMMSPFKGLELEDVPRFRAELLRFEAMQAAFSQAKKLYLEQAKSAEFLATDMDTSTLPVPPPEPDTPVNLRFTVGDTSSQKLVDLIAVRPEGLSLVLDEGASWIEKVCSLKSGDDRSMWTVSYEGNSYSFDRVTRGSLTVENLAISAYMNVQPNILMDNMTVLQKDGMLQRFIPFIIPEKNGSRVSNPLPKWASTRPQWEKLLRQVYAVGEKRYRLCYDAHDLYRDFEIWVEEIKEAHSVLNSSDGFQSSVGKFTGLMGRIALLFHLGTEPWEEVLPAERIREAVKFMKEFVYWSVYGLYCITGEEGYDRWVFDWIITGSEEVFTDSSVRRSARRQLEGKSLYEQREVTYATLQYFCSKNVIMELESDDRRITKYAVNPNVRKQFAGRRQEVAKMKQFVIDQAAGIAERAIGREVIRKTARGYVKP